MSPVLAAAAATAASGFTASKVPQSKSNSTNSRIQCRAEENNLKNFLQRARIEQENNLVVEKTPIDLKVHKG
ncbi:MAG: hypothetical protein CM15mV123_120 [uncultured marine virus]|nr:MAG: hypothetical protein CM15mV123_120 [uncultured marine virus]